jgi:hypothetical protein
VNNKEVNVRYGILILEKQKNNELNIEVKTVDNFSKIFNTKPEEDKVLNVKLVL